MRLAGSFADVNPVLPSAVTPIVRRHAEDAAFYWQQLDASPGSARLEWDRYAHFDRLPDLNIEGLRRAGEVGLDLAREGLARWQQPGEVFVCAMLALPRGASAMQPVLDGVCDTPESTARGLISALLRAPADHSQPLLQKWLGDDSTPAALQMIAWRAVALGAALPHDSERALTAALGHAQAPVRAAACRAAWRVPAHAVDLGRLFSDPDLAVRAEAAIASGLAVGDQEAARLLMVAIVELAASREAKTGWHRKQLDRRLLRWVRHAAWMLEPGAQTDREWLAKLPVTHALAYAAQRGDPRLEDIVIAVMSDPSSARYAGWVWQTLRGVDIEQAGLTIDETQVASDDATQPLPDEVSEGSGMALPDAAAVAAYAATHPLPDDGRTRMIFGQAWSGALTLAMLEQGVQYYRAMAAMAMRHGAARQRISVRASVAIQRQAMQAMQAMREEERP